LDFGSNGGALLRTCQPSTLVYQLVFRLASILASRPISTLGFTLIYLDKIPTPSPPALLRDISGGGAVVPIIGRPREPIEHPATLLPMSKNNPQIARKAKSEIHSRPRPR
jgi:hypothetical protein